MLMMIFKFIGMCIVDYTIGKVVDAIGDSALSAISCPVSGIPKIGQPFIVSLK